MAHSPSYSPRTHRISSPRYPELEQHYELFETLGSGGFAKVKLGVHRLTGEKVAVKIMNKKQLGEDLPRVYREIRALKKLHHQHVCQLFQVIDTDTMIYMALEYCSGGELFDYIVAKEKLKEGEARTFFRQIVSALMYVHTSGFIHRDLKPENLLLDDDSNIKLIDFGLVAEPKDIRELLQTCCGSPAYAAPELIKGGPYIGPRADVWSLGVLLYALLNGFLPFDDDNTAELYRLIQSGRYDTPRWLSIDSIYLLSKLLQTIPERRISVEDLLTDPWVMKDYNRKVAWESKINLSDLDEECVNELAKYHCIEPPAMANAILKWNYDEITAAYFLLLQQKLSGKTPRIKAPPKKIKVHIPNNSTHPLRSPTISPLDNPLLHAEQKKKNEQDKLSDEEGSNDDEEEEEEEVQTKQVKPVVPSPRVRKISLGQPMHPPTLGEIVSLQKEASPKIGRPVHPAINNILLQETGPIPIPRKPRDTLNLVPLTPPPSSGGSISASPSFHHSGYFTPQVQPRVVKTISFDARLNLMANQREVDETEPLEQSLPSPGRKRRFGSVDLVLGKMKKVFRRPSSAEDKKEAGPRRVRGLFDVKTTSRKSESQVMTEIERVLTEMNIPFTNEKNYTYVCKLDPLFKRGSKKDMEFSLEICYIPNIEMIGIKRKRIRGDVWRYKEVCEQIFKATRL